MQENKATMRIGQWECCTWKVLPCPLPPQMPRIRGTLILGSSMKFLATWIDILSRKAGLI